MASGTEERPTPFRGTSRAKAWSSRMIRCFADFCLLRRAETTKHEQDREIALPGWLSREGRLLRFSQSLGYQKRRVADRPAIGARPCTP